MAQPTEETLIQVLERLKKEGFTLDFNLEPDSIHCSQENLRLKPEAFEIVETVRLEGMSDPDDNVIVYAIESRDGERGVLISAYGVYAEESTSAELAAKLAVNRES
ncbi:MULTISPECIES: phosphoribosylpyrophosphate synthetase [unclassified Siphonobacter]|uniref:phosphoribosylpyrophosphate synthetase n=1 Tax=unclassified Siphonobacter TaxID=2635712 RepID=UPI000CB098CC|nr:MULTISPECIES: phosphoribosylpyrophosphate synthetase [unclassified Siphonobacter]MDQ1089232.1 hypothetical protein [Siphonobacter sp. SORGH_AS_1065]MDR6195405.1 hypothetical protein [Siphonobacter sp. SORGH_AS_0500]PKK34882.1 hypothetical protein BWI96_19940 [Siphonobacter sp. SORGH_AS_0500]